MDKIGTPSEKWNSDEFERNKSFRVAQIVGLLLALIALFLKFYGYFD
mgnify:CR=1 FL=1